MRKCEYCELWWSEGGHPRLTFYRPMGSETVAFEQESAVGDTDEWDAMRGAISELALSGWQLVATTSGSEGLFFRRHLQ